MAPFADWLKASRRSQTQPENGRPWTQEYFLARLKAETGWALTKAPYIALERGESQPRPDTRMRLVAFWERHGVEAPDLTPQAPQLSLEERAVLAAERAADAAERQAAATEFIAWSMYRQQAPVPATPEEMAPILAMFRAEVLERSEPRRPTVASHA